MVLGGQKKDSQDQQSKAAKHSGLTSDEAAAIVLAATRGVSPANALGKKSLDDAGHSSKNSGATADEVAAIIRAATRGRSPTNTPLKSGSLQGIKPISKMSSKDISGISLTAGLSGSNSQSDKKGYHKASSDVTVATVIAKSVAIAASREADSAEAGLTKEQKLKAERLKRAKMFAALIKSGNSSLGEQVNSFSHHSGSMEPSNGGSVQIDTDSKTAGIEREGSSVPFDDAALGKESESRKRRHSRHDDSDGDHKISRKDHHLSRHKDEQSFRHHNHYSSSKDEHRHKRSSEHRHHRRNHDHVSDDEDREHSEQRRKKHHSHSSRKQESEARNAMKSMERFGGPSVGLTGDSDRRDLSASDDKQTSHPTEIPNDLRAKIRAMLLETL